MKQIDKLKTMNAVEIANLIGSKHFFCNYCPRSDYIEEEDCSGLSCKQVVLNWLNSEI